MLDLVTHEWLFLHQIDSDAGTIVHRRIDIRKRISWRAARRAPLVPRQGRASIVVVQCDGSGGVTLSMPGSDQAIADVDDLSDFAASL